MPYITPEYYLNNYKGKPIEDQQELSRMILRASEAIDILTNYKIEEFDDLPEKIKELVKKATAILTEYYIACGGYDETIEVESPERINIGDFSYSYSVGKNEKRKEPEKVIQILSYTGLLYMGVGDR